MYHGIEYYLGLVEVCKWCDTEIASIVNKDNGLVRFNISHCNICEKMEPETVWVKGDEE